jgi:hypothetical protein
MSVLLFPDEDECRRCPVCGGTVTYVPDGQEQRRIPWPVTVESHQHPERYGWTYLVEIACAFYACDCCEWVKPIRKEA